MCLYVCMQFDGVFAYILHVSAAYTICLKEVVRVYYVVFALYQVDGSITECTDLH